jgi:DnaJ-domain-containing protein 1
VVDYFALLQEPRRPWLDPDLLKSKFLTLSAEAHPDRVHGHSPDEKQSAQNRYTDLNTAYQTLREPKNRLAHLLELESGQKPSAIQSAPGELMDLFLEIAGVCRQVDKWVEEKHAESSPLLQVTLFERGQALGEKLTALQQIVKQRSEAAEKALQSLDSAWEPTRPAGTQPEASQLPLAHLEECYRTFSYLSRWSAQLQERFVQLSL